MIEKSYCQQRLDLLGISNEDNIAWESQGKQLNHFYNDSFDNIVIRYCEPLVAAPLTFVEEGSRFTKHYERIRLKAPINDIKYLFKAKKALIRPYWNGILQYFTKKCILPPFKTLYIVEGEFKAFMMCKMGVPAIGISGKDCFGKTIRDASGNKKGYELLPEIKEFLNEYKPENLVFLQDADAIQNEGRPKRALGFWMSVVNMVEATKKYSVNLYYALVRENEKESKGIDDLFCDFPKEHEVITKCLFELANNKFIRFINLNSIHVNELLDSFKVQVLTPFDKALKEVFELNLKRNEITGFLTSEGKTITEAELNGIYIDVRSSIKISKSEWEILINSNKIDAYNPLKAFFNQNQHIKETGLVEKLTQCLGATTGLNGKEFYPEYEYTFIKKWLVALVASVYGDNYNVMMLVLVGPKNTGKTEFFKRLFQGTGLEEYFIVSKFCSGKDSEAQMCENLLILNDELDSLNKVEAKTFRNFISANKYTYRPPYGKQNVTRKRLATVCGTSNDKHIILDHENNRRIVPIEISGKIDFQLYNSIDKTTLLMEAYHLFQEGFDYNLTDKEIAMLSECTEDFAVIGPEVELIQKYFRNPALGEPLIREFSATEIKDFIEFRSKQRLNKEQVGKALNFLGFKQGRGRQGRFYRVVEVQQSEYVSIQKYN